MERKLKLFEILSAVGQNPKVDFFDYTQYIYNII